MEESESIKRMLLIQRYCHAFKRKYRIDHQEQNILLTIHMLTKEKIFVTAADVIKYLPKRTEIFAYNALRGLREKEMVDFISKTHTGKPKTGTWGRNVYCYTANKNTVDTVKKFFDGYDICMKAFDKKKTFSANDLLKYLK